MPLQIIFCKSTDLHRGYICGRAKETNALGSCSDGESFLDTGHIIDASGFIVPALG